MDKLKEAASKAFSAGLGKVSRISVSVGAGEEKNGYDAHVG